jgi:hypothetical protein
MIGRLNVGGPSIQAITLTRELDARGYQTVLVRGREGLYEGTMDDLADELRVTPLRVYAMRREFGIHDVVALARTVWLLARVRPTVLHAHAAKAGAVGRLAALLLGPGAPRVRVHTFHGHVLTGYFGRRRSSLFVAVERLLARSTTQLVAASEEVRDELVALVGCACPAAVRDTAPGVRISHSGPASRAVGTFSMPFPQRGAGDRQRVDQIRLARVRAPRHAPAIGWVQTRPTVSRGRSEIAPG